MEEKEITKRVLNEMTHMFNRHGRKLIHKHLKTIKIEQPYPTQIYVYNCEFVEHNTNLKGGTIITVSPSGDLKYEPKQIKTELKGNLIEIKNITYLNNTNFSIKYKELEERRPILKEMVAKKVGRINFSNESKIERYLYDIFKNTPPEILEKLIQQ